MAFQEHARKFLARDKTAAFPPFPPKQNAPPPPPGSPQKREIPKDHQFDPRALKPMSKALLATSVALGHALTAYRHFSRLKSTTISPDGRIGGRGYIMSMTEIRRKLFEACEGLSAIADTLYDEVNAPHWLPRLAQLDENDQEDVERFVEESKEVLGNPEEEAEERLEAIEEENDKKEKKEPPKSDDEAKSGLPGTGGVVEEAAPPMATKEASALPITTVPGGPRLDGWDPDQWGSEQDEEGSDEYAYRSEWENDYSHHQAVDQWAESVLPSDDTPTEAWDFGVGYGARGQGAGGYANPSDEGGGRGAWGPATTLPGGLSETVDSDTSAVVDVNLNERHSEGLLPGDTDEPVARRDEYEGPKGNLVQTAEAWAESLPGGESAFVETDQPIDIDTGYVSEDLTTPWLPLEAPGTTRTE